MARMLIWLGLMMVAGGLNAQPQQSDTLGAQLARVCAACHNLDASHPHKLGPNLWDLVNRPVASAEGYEYSNALLKLGGNWTPTRLDSFLQDPAAMAPGTRMAFPGIKDKDQRAALLDYLASLSDTPAAPREMAAETATFAFDGLPSGQGQAEVYATCSACHSLMIVKQQGMNRDRWKQTLEWMVEEQGMDELPPHKLQVILDYLSEHFGE